MLPSLLPLAPAALLGPLLNPYPCPHLTSHQEFFVQYAAEKSYEIAKAEAKPKRSLTYSHVSNAVARNDNLEFLSDIAPQTTTWRNYKESRAGQKASSRGSKALDPKQTTLGGTVVGAGSSAAGVAAAVSGAATTNKADLSLAMHPVDAGPGPVNGAGKEVGKGRGRAKDVDGDVNMS
jgi:hypothetical protein